MNAHDATEAAYKNGYADAAAEFKVQLEKMQANLKVKVETLEKIARELPYACEYCAHRFADDLTICLECDDEWHNGNFKWRGIEDD